MKSSERAEASEAQPSEKGQGGQELPQDAPNAPRTFQALTKDELKDGIQKIQSFSEGLMLVWAWFKTWTSMARNGYMVYTQQPHPDITNLAPLVVMVVGLVTTNILGFLHFWREGLYREARLAAVDLDAPYLGYQHMMSFLHGETNPEDPELQKARLRNSIWRSLPLAMLTCALTSRMLVEVPLCQAVASGSATVVGIWPQYRNQSLWVAKLGNLNSSQAEWAKRRENFGKDKESIEEKQSPEGLKIAQDMLKLEKTLWTAAHCNLSKWTLTELPLKMERLEDQVGAVGGESDEDQAGNHLSNLVPFNVVVFEEFKSQALQREDSLRSALDGYINDEEPTSWTGFVGGRLVASMSWKGVVDLAISWLKRSFGMSRPRGTLESSRPWTFHIPFFREVDPGLGEWKMPLVQAVALLVTSILPVRKQILLPYGQVPATCKLLVTLYVCLDMTLLLITWLLCAVAPLATRFGNLVVDTIRDIWPRVEEIVREEELHAADSTLFRLLVTGFPKFEGDFLRLEPAIAWDTRFFLELSLGSLAFLAASAALTYAVSPDLRLSTCATGRSGGATATVGVCGPLWIFTEAEHTVYKGPKACKLVLCRFLMLASLVVSSWKRVPKLGMELFTAFTIKWRLDWDTFMRLWLFLAIPTAFFGLLSAQSLSLEEPESDSESNSKDEDAEDAESSKSNYGTFTSSESDSIP